MKIRQVTLQVEVPWEFKADEVLECLVQGFDELGYSSIGLAGIRAPHQEQIIGNIISTNTQIGEIKQWPPR